MVCTIKKANMQEFAKVLLAKKASGGKFTKLFYSTLYSIVYMYRIIDRKNYSSQTITTSPAAFSYKQYREKNYIAGAVETVRLNKLARHNIRYNLTQTRHLHVYLLLSKFASRLRAHKRVPGSLWQTVLMKHNKLLELSPTVFVSDKPWVTLRVTYSWVNKSLGVGFFSSNLCDYSYIST